MKNKDIQRLRSLVPLNTLSEEAFQRLFKTLKVDKFAAGDAIFREGDTDNQYVYAVAGSVALLSGNKQLTTVSADSEEARLALAHHLPRKVSAQALSPTTVVRLDGALLNELMNSHQGRDYEVSDYEGDDAGDWMDRLLRSGVFQQISPANLQGVLMRMESVEYAKGDEVIRQGESGDYYYVLKQGRCAVLVANNGERKQVAELIPGQGFGEEALLSGHTRASTIVMLTDGEVMRLGKDDFVKFIARPMARRLTYEQAAKAVEAGAVWLDGQEPEEHAKVNLQGSVNLPFSSVRLQHIELPRDHHYIAYTADGQNCSTAAFLLTERGYTVSVLDGGLAKVPPAQLLSPRAVPASQPAAAKPAPSPRPTDSSNVGGGEAAKLQAELDAITDRWQQAGARVEELESKVQDLQGDQGLLVKKQTEELKQLKSILVDARDKLTTANQQRKEALAAEQSATKERDKLRANEHKLRQSLAEMESRSQRLNEEFEQARRHWRETEERAAEERETRAAAFDLQLSEAKDQLEEVQAARLEAETRIQELSHQHAAEQTRLESELGSLRDRLGELQAGLEQAEARNQGLEREGQALDGRLKQAESARDAAAVQAEQVASENRNRIAALEKQIDEGSKAQTELEQQLGELQDRLTQTETARDAASAEAERLSAEQQQQLAELQDRLTRAETARDAASSNNERLSEEFQHQLAELQERLTRAETARDAASADAQRLGEEHQTALAELQQRIDSLDEQRQELESRLERERLDAQSKLSAAQEALSAQTELAAELERRIEGLDEERHGLEKAFGQERGGLHKQLDEAREQVERARIEREGSESELTGHFEKQLADGRERVDAAEAAQRETQEQLEGLEKVQRETQARHEGEVQDLNRQLAELESELATTRQQAASALDSGESLAKTHQQALDRMSAELGEAQARLEQAERSRGELDTELEALRGELTALRESRDSTDSPTGETSEREQALQGQLDAADSRFAALEAEAEELRERNAELSEELETSQSGAEESGTILELRTELEHGRQQSAMELSELREQLEQARTAAANPAVTQAGDEAEQRITSLENLLAEREESLEHITRELEQTKLDLEEETYQRKDADEARRQLEEALYQTNEDKEMPAAAPDRQDTTAVMVYEKMAPTKLGMVGGIAGVILALLLSEAVLFASGRGELFTGAGEDEPAWQPQPNLD